MANSNKAKRAAAAREKRKTPEHKAWKREYQRKYRAEINERQRLYRLANPEYDKMQRDRYKAEHGEKRKMLGRLANRKRKGMPEPTRPEPPGCEICGRTPTRASLHLDHCHETNKFRGWLCSSCNNGIGLLGDNSANVLRAVEYLRRAESK